MILWIEEDLYGKVSYQNFLVFTFNLFSILIVVDISSPKQFALNQKQFYEKVMLFITVTLTVIVEYLIINSCIYGYINSDS